MVKYHVTGDLYILNASATQANTLFTQITTRANVTGAAFSTAGK